MGSQYINREKTDYKQVVKLLFQVGCNRLQAADGLTSTTRIKTDKLQKAVFLKHQTAVVEITSK